MDKVQVTLVGEDGNIFNLMGIASKAMKKAGQSEEAKEMTEKIFTSGSYDEALSIISQYCEVN
jgi:hypothetical protein